MTNPATPSGGMPKWLIFLLVFLLLIMLGCCGGIATCHWACQRGVNAVQSAAQQAQQNMERRMAEQQRLVQEQQRLAQENEKANGVAPERGGTAGGTGSTTGNTGGNAPRTTAEELGTGKLPSNFPTDVPLMNGLAPTSVSFADKLKGSGMATLSGKAKHEDIVAYYEKELKTRNWIQDSNQDVGELTVMSFTKDNRKLSLSISPDTDKVSSIVQVVYETQP